MRFYCDIVVLTKGNNMDLNIDLMQEKNETKASFQRGDFIFDIYAKHDNEQYCEDDIEVYMTNKKDGLDYGFDDILELPLYLEFKQGFIHVSDLKVAIAMQLNNIDNSHFFKGGK
jgi:hypothetical protein